MSRRFGRQQKRRMRAEIAQLADAESSLRDALHMQAGLTSHIRQKLDQYRSQLSDVAGVLGENFIALDPQMLKRTLDQVDNMRMPAPCSMMDYLTLMKAEARCGNMRMTEEIIEMVLFSGRYQFDEVMRQMHFVVKCNKPGMEIAYAVSESAIRSHDPNELADNITRILRQGIKNAIIELRAK